MKYKLDKPQLDLNMAPMIDVVFLLLIFFIVASTLNVKEVETMISLPDTETVKKQRQTEIVIAITEEGKTYIEGKEISLKKLKNFLEARLEQNKQNNRDISIYADKEVTFQKVVKVMDIVKKLQVDNLSFLLRRGDT